MSNYIRAYICLILVCKICVVFIITRIIQTKKKKKYISSKKKEDEHVAVRGRTIINQINPKKKIYNFCFRFISTSERQTISIAFETMK